MSEDRQPDIFFHRRNVWETLEMNKEQLETLRLQLSHAFTILEFIEEKFADLGPALRARAPASLEDQVLSEWGRLVRKLSDMTRSADEILQDVTRKPVTH